MHAGVTDTLHIVSMSRQPSLPTVPLAVPLLITADYDSLCVAHRDTETIGCDPSLSSIPTGEQRTLDSALEEVRQLPP